MLPVGSHRILFEHTSSGVEKDTLITIRADQLTEITCYFEHEISFLTRWDQPSVAPFASFSVAGGEKMQTPKVVYLGPGTHQIQASRQGFDIENAQQTIRVAPTFDISKTVHKVFFEIQKAQ